MDQAAAKAHQQVFNAFADGQPIQCRWYQGRPFNLATGKVTGPGKWSEWTDCSTMIISRMTEYRIKP